MKSHLDVCDSSFLEIAWKSATTLNVHHLCMQDSDWPNVL